MNKIKTFTTEFVNTCMAFTNNDHHKLQISRQPRLKDAPLQKFRERYFDSIIKVLYEDISPEVLSVYDEEFIKNKRKEERFRKLR